MSRPAVWSRATPPGPCAGRSHRLHQRTVHTPPMPPTKVPFLDLKEHHQLIRAEIMKAMNEVIDANAFAGGPFVARFEEAYARFCEVPHCVGVANGTDSLWFSLLALGIGAG